MHLAKADGIEERCVFKTNDPVSIIRLVLFIWNIRGDLKRITTECELATPHVVRGIQEHDLLQWRADTTSHFLSGDPLTQEELFSLWMDRLQSSKEGV